MSDFQWEQLCLRNEEGEAQAWLAQRGWHRDGSQRPSDIELDALWAAALEHAAHRAAQALAERVGCTASRAMRQRASEVFVSLARFRLDTGTRMEKVRRCATELCHALPQVTGDQLVNLAGGHRGQDVALLIHRGVWKPSVDDGLNLFEVLTRNRIPVNSAHHMARAWVSTHPRLAVEHPKAVATMADALVECCLSCGFSPGRVLLEATAEVLESVASSGHKMKKDGSYVRRVGEILGGNQNLSMALLTLLSAMGRAGYSLPRAPDIREALFRSVLDLDAGVDLDASDGKGAPDPRLALDPWRRWVTSPGVMASIELGQNPAVTAVWQQWRSEGLQRRMEKAWKQPQQEAPRPRARF